MHRYRRHRPVDKVVCRQRFTGDLTSSDLTLETFSGADPGPSGPDPSLAAQRLADLYFSSLFRLSLGLARARTNSFDAGDPDAGESTELYFSLAPFFPLITLGPPHTKAGAQNATVAYPVTGGALSRRPSAGFLVFEVDFSKDRTTLTVRVRDFPSRLAGDCDSLLRRALYRSTQWLFHRLLVARFLRHAGPILAPARR
jgi:hypothetical protein